MKTKRIRGTNVNEPDLFDKNGYGICQELFDGIVDFLNGPMEDIEVDIAEEDLDAELASPLDDLTTLSCIFGTDASKREERKKLPPVSDTTEMKSFFREMENKSGQKVITAASSTSSAPDAQRKCMHCKVTTPQWKKGPLGPHTLCNACGVCYKSGRLYRPNFGAPSNFRRKVIELANIVENTSSRSIPLLNDFPRKKRSCPFHTPDCCASKRFHPLAASAPFYASSDYPKALFPKNTNKKQKRKNRKKSSGSSGKSSIVEIKIKPVHKDAIAASSIFLAALHSNSSEKVVETVDKTGQEAITASSTIIAPLHSISCKNDVVTANKTGRKVALAENPTSVTSLSANSPKMNSLQVKVKDKKCMHCGVKSTPQWRNGPLGMCTLCNACGVRYRSGRLFPEYRPLASPTFVPSLHSNFHRKVLEKRKKVCKEAAVTTTNGNNSPARFDLNELPELDELPDLNE